MADSRVELDLEDLEQVDGGNNPIVDHIKNKIEPVVKLVEDGKDKEKRSTLEYAEDVLSAASAVMDIILPH